MTRMREVDLTLRTHLDADSQWQKKPRRLRHSRALTLTLATILVALTVRNGPIGFDSNLLHAEPSHIAVIHGVAVRADKVIVLVDDSGSMDTKRAEVRWQVGRLRGSGISVADEIKVFGFALSYEAPYTLLKTLDDNLTADKSIDTVYVITDFFGPDYEANLPGAYQELRQIVRGHGVRLYWATVDKEPISEYSEIAQRSGGSVIPKF